VTGFHVLALAATAAWVRTPAQVVIPTAFALGAIVALAALSALLGLLLRELPYVLYGATLTAFVFATLNAPEPFGFVALAVFYGLLLALCAAVAGDWSFSRLASRIALAVYGALLTAEALYRWWPAIVNASGLAPILAPLLTMAFVSSAVALVLPVLRWERQRAVYAAAFAVTLAGLGIARAAITGWLHPSAFASYAPEVAVVVQALLLASALADRIRFSESVTRTLITERSELENAALRDVLTGIPNRRAFDERLNDEWRAAQRNGTSLAVVLIDVDYFKAYNDTLGHVNGDEVLRAVGRAIALSLRGREDFAARYGGEEFVVVMPGCDVTAAGELGRRVCGAVKAHRIAHPGAPTGVLTVSAGAASATPRRNRRTSSLIERADGALYAAKRSGRDRVCLSGAPVAPEQIAAEDIA